MRRSFIDVCLIILLSITTRTQAQDNNTYPTILNDTVPPLSFDNDNDNNKSHPFLSFEEWKEVKFQEQPLNMNNPPHLRNREPVDPSCYKERESIGDEMEIELGFFAKDEQEQEDKPYNRRYNYASLDCAATVVKSNAEAIGSTSILVENKDQYLLNPCSAVNKFVIIELCEDVLVEEVEMANFEFFSSTFKTIRLSVSDRFPVSRNGWVVLGEFEAENNLQIQQFNIKNPQIWARYLRVEVLSYYNNEFYCPISLIRAHGKTMMDEFKMGQIANDEVVSTTKLEDVMTPDETSNVTIEDELESTDKINEGGNSHTTMDVATVITRNSNTSINSKSNIEYFEKCTIWSYDDYSNVSVVPFELSHVLENGHCKFEPLNFTNFFLKRQNDTFNNGDSSNNNGTSKRNGTCNVTMTPMAQSPTSPEESIFKNIIKRLNALENNSTLTVLYIEEQSQLLSKSFQSLTKEHGIKFANLIDNFNTMIIARLDSLKEFAADLKDQSLQILTSQRLENERFVAENSYRIRELEREVRLQKFIVYSMFFVLMGLLTYLLFAKEVYIVDDLDNRETTPDKVVYTLKSKTQLSPNADM
ncbi:hypothetical protein NCAS_0H02780 [Naumovozyma castellii]|uniref:SUN-like protein 1 n=1 Tax=Naumovozyma castellii TaxID=27288 RepID=G0VJA9_NAUCA|nr:hypothetical protein NCAS_0H02780 [Naumovozyma castellii CBS 4309]CCC71588.1 hypothetical protein NCAS_0H02780 [Naumovozyma castellii CBS 4309]